MTECSFMVVSDHQSAISHSAKEVTVHTLDKNKGRRRHSILFCNSGQTLVLPLSEVSLGLLMIVNSHKTAFH